MIGYVRLTRFSHSCVRLEVDGVVVVVDPGVWSEPEALAGADAVLVTHEHTDHVDESLLTGLDCPIFAPADAALTRVAFTPVVPGQSFRAAGLDVVAVGGEHAKVVPAQKPCANLGYVIADVYHPGDALYPISQPVDTVLVPMQASWLKTSEAIDFLGTLTYIRSFGIHDGQINHRAVTSINAWYEQSSQGRYTFLAPGNSA